VGLVFYLCRYRKNNFPKIIYISVVSAILSFLAYGILAGIIVPKSDFLPASVINYTSFSLLMGGIPVHIFRAACAMALAASFFGTLGIYYRENDTQIFRTSIRMKLTLIISLSIFTVLVLGMILLYMTGSKTLNASITQEYIRISSLLAKQVSSNISDEIEDAESYTTRLLWIEASKKANESYAGMDEGAIKKYLIDMDKKWSEASPGSPLYEKIFNNEVARSMTDVLYLRPHVSEIFITDKFGGVVHASGKTSDFYQADEEWWQKAYNHGKGTAYVGDVEYDESSSTWVISLAVPIRERNGELVGICKVSVSINKLFSFLQNLRIGKTGHAAIVNNAGRIIYHESLNPLSTDYINEYDFKKTIADPTRHSIIKNPHVHNSYMFTVYSVVPSKFAVRSNDIWRVFIEQATYETFSSLNNFILQLAVITAILAIIMIPIGFFFGGIFIKPLRKLQGIATEISKGNFDYEIDIKTGDEIEQFANAFSRMITNLKNKQDELVIARDELIKMSENLEKTVEERTIDLRRTQEATLNILEDLTEAKVRLDKYTKDLEEALRIKSDFTSTVSHELRTPLAAIKESVAIVLDGITGNITQDQANFLGIAKKNIDRLARLINDVLDFQKLESGRMALNKRLNDINVVVKEVKAMMAPLTAEKHLALDLDLENDLPNTLFDKDKIIQVITNLVSNAIKFTEAGGIIISTSEEKNLIKVSISDTGPGISKDNIQKLFRRFEQLESGIDRKVGGTGLGLAISKEIIDLHEGFIWVESTPGKGSSFIFTLPIDKKETESA